MWLDATKPAGRLPTHPVVVMTEVTLVMLDRNRRNLVQHVAAIIVELFSVVKLRFDNARQVCYIRTKFGEMQMLFIALPTRPRPTPAHRSGDFVVSL